MKKMLLAVVVFALFALGFSGAQEKPDLVGTWQGTLDVGKSLRIVMKTKKSDGGGLETIVYSIDQSGRGLEASGTSFNGSLIKVTVSAIEVTYQGKLSADGNFITGTWAQGEGKELPLTLARAHPETAWTIPEPAPPPKMMAADADPSFEVATIKPSGTDAKSMQQLTVNGRNFATRASSLGDLISFAYEVQAKQIVGGPDWMDKDRFDIDAVPDKEGAPSAEQVRAMIRKLLTERFKLDFHKDKRDLSAFVLSVSKSGQKLRPTQLSGPLPGLGIHPGTGGLTISMRNGTLADFTGFLQALVLDRPVVDDTQLAGKYDLDITFTPDDTQFNGHPPQLPTAADAASAAPSFGEALQQQLGLRLEVRKAPVTVIAVDHVERFSAN